jgi:hypothetical protein
MQSKTRNHPWDTSACHLTRVSLTTELGFKIVTCVIGSHFLLLSQQEIRSLPPHEPTKLRHANKNIYR